MLAILSLTSSNSLSEDLAIYIVAAETSYSDYKLK